MKYLFLNRHAKSDWSNSDIIDFDRSLSERGMTDAPKMGKRLSENEGKIESFISSPAKRAWKTAEIIAENCEYPISDIQKEPIIYEAGVRDLLKLVNNLDNNLSSVILFGHNPGFTDFADYLTGSGILNIPTCGICKITFELDSWKEISAHNGNLMYFDFPKREIVH